MRKKTSSVSSALPSLTLREARRIWLQAQGLTEEAPFGRGPKATVKAIKHLGAVQIDTIFVIERCHHHILYSRIPGYRTDHLRQAQTVDKTVFEYWTNALSYIATDDFRFFVNDMRTREEKPSTWYKNVSKGDVRRLLERIEELGPLSIQDINDEPLLDEVHEWESRKPSKRVMQFGFNAGKLVISERRGMLKKYELTERHFDWEGLPDAATEEEVLRYALDRAIRTQGVISLESASFMSHKRKAALRALIAEDVKQKKLVPVRIEGLEKKEFWIWPKSLEKKVTFEDDLTHLLSPYDPIVIQRKRFNSFFECDYVYEAFIPEKKRKFGFFALPVLMNDEIVAFLDLKADREEQKLKMQKWTWLAKKKSAGNKKKIEEELDRFAKFQFGK